MTFYALLSFVLEKKAKVFVSENGRVDESVSDL